MKAMSLEQTNIESARWLRFLSRWALVTVLTALALLSVYLGGIGFSPADNALGAEYSELLQAVRTPIMYRVAMTLDTSSWVMMGGALLTLAFILKGRMPIRAMFVAACGIGLLSGVSAGVMRLVGISDLAARYAVATPAQQAALLQPMLTLYETIGALFVVGDLLVGAAYLLVASGLLLRRAFPRWLTGWFVVAGILSLLQGVTSAVGAFSFPILLLTIVFGIIGLHAAIAVALWRPSPALVSATASA
jgi:hypothetical protein